MPRQLIDRNANVILIYGAWPDPRGGGILSVVHDQILALNELHQTVLLICSASSIDHTAAESSIFLAHIPSGRPFNWKKAVSEMISFGSFEELAQADRSGWTGFVGLNLDQVSIIHSHSDTIIPRDEAGERKTNDYVTLLEHIEHTYGRRPKLVRTRHEDLHGTLDRLMRLTGIDYVELNSDHRQVLLDGGIDLEHIVARHTADHRRELIAQGWNEDYTDAAIHHVWFAISQLRLWQREQADADMIVSLGDASSQQLKSLLPGDFHKHRYVYNGTSFLNRDRARIDRLLYDYHVNRGLACYRGGAKRKERISFSPHNQKVVFVGRDDISKGVNELVLALRDLYHGGYSNVRAIIVGRFSQERRQQLCQHDPQCAPDYLLFTGWVADADELASILAFGNVTAIPSHYDSFNLVGCESYLMGTPCVVTERIGAAEVYLTNPARHSVQIALPVRKPFATGPNRFFGVDVTSLASQLATILDDDHLAISLSEEGRKFVETHYSYREMGKRYLDIYLSLLKDPSCQSAISKHKGTTSHAHE